MGFDRKLFIALGMCVLVAGAFAVVALGLVMSLSSGLYRSVHVGAKGIELAGDVHAEVQDMTALARAVQVVFAIRKLETPATAGTCSGCHTVQHAMEAVPQMTRSAENVKKKVAALKPLLTESESRNAAERMERSAGAWVDAWGRFLKTVQAEYEQGHEVITTELVPQTAQIGEAADRLREQQTIALQRLYAELTDRIEAQKWTALALLALGVVVNIATVMLVRRVCKTVRRETNLLATSASAVRAASEEIAGAGENIADRAASQASALEETSAAGGQVLSTAEQNNDHAVEASRVLESVRESVEQANNSMTRLTAAMERSRAAGCKVSAVAKTIEEIALQTNLLALNASVEAARAGAAGAGFSVVATEVRMLAARCSDAARETASLMEEATASSTEGQETLDRAMNSFRAVAVSVQGLTNRMDAVRSGGEQQVEAMRQIAESMSAMGQNSTEFAASATQSVATGEKLRSNAQVVHETVDRLNALIDGAKRTSGGEHAE